MNQETNRPFDILLVEAETGRLTKVATAWSTPRGAGYRFTSKATIPEGAQFVILPSRNRAKTVKAPAPDDGEE